ncbi:HAD family hydrolase [Kitasatospora cheerisanensis]|uniref:Cytochrome-c oxidase n=1 Tax=Kitasatospora cheerisanensis KCTC 2395 TaxID=1348663 RepID=A0A066ZBL3_9ACTN|nr:HAD family phosphatase [Kitasatospora cheerisanensis]KDN87550.1 cytochrome-c oxidase [Kitasatospora cheerisanensis KCTC 2395]
MRAGRPGHFAALSDTLAPLGIEVGWSWYLTHTGTSTPETIGDALRRHGVTPVEPVDALVAVCEERYLDHLAEVREIPRVADLARSLAGRLPLAVASGGMRRTVQATMAHLGLTGLFSCTVTRDDVAEGKPAPEIFLLAAERLGVDPARCLVLEDSDSGLLAAHRAGMAAVDIRTDAF